MSTNTTADIPDRKGIRCLAWGVGKVVLCGIIFVHISYAFPFPDSPTTPIGIDPTTSGPIGPVPTIPPTVKNIAPQSESDISKNNKIVVIFSESMNPTSLKLGGELAAESDGGKWSSQSWGAIEIKNTTLTISPKTQWTVGRQRTLTIDAKDLDGNRLAETLSLKYTVVEPPDKTPPQASSVAPSSSSAITQSNQIVINFTESMNPASLELGGEMAAESDRGVWSTRKNKDDTLTISPMTQWSAGSQRTLTIEVKDIAENPLATLSLWYAVTSKGTPSTLKWRFQTGDKVQSSPAIRPDGTLYVGSDDGYIYALNPKGMLKWRFKTGGSVRSSPAIGPDGTLYAGSFDHYIYALDPNGEQKWRFQTGDIVLSSPAIGPDGTLYVGSVDDYIYALNPNGEEKWRFQAWADVNSSPAIGSDGTLYVGSLDGYVYALNPEGTLKWGFQTGDKVLSSPAIGSDGTLYVGSIDHYVYALNPDGTLKWLFDTGERIYSSPVIGADGTIYIGSDSNQLALPNPPIGPTDPPIFLTDIYLPHSDSFVYALNADGTLKWRFETGGAVWSSLAIGSDGTFYVVANNDNIYALNSDGTLKWRFETPVKWTVESSPAIGQDGTVYIVLGDDNLYAINGSTSLSTVAPWPKFHHDNLNTGRVSAGN
jgi:outer membrane protein assembly factor BamB